MFAGAQQPIASGGVKRPADEAPDVVLQLVPDRKRLRKIASLPISPVSRYPTLNRSTSLMPLAKPAPEGRAAIHELSPAKPAAEARKPWHKLSFAKRASGASKLRPELSPPNFTSDSSKARHELSPAKPASEGSRPRHKLSPAKPASGSSKPGVRLSSSSSASKKRTVAKQVDTAAQPFPGAKARLPISTTIEPEASDTLLLALDPQRGSPLQKPVAAKQSTKTSPGKANHNSVAAVAKTAAVVALKLAGASSKIGFDRPNQLKSIANKPILTAAAEIVKNSRSSKSSNSQGAKLAADVNLSTNVSRISSDITSDKSAAAAKLRKTSSVRSSDSQAGKSTAAANRNLEVSSSSDVKGSKAAAGDSVPQQPKSLLQTVGSGSTAQPTVRDDAGKRRPIGGLGSVPLPVLTRKADDGDKEGSGQKAKANKPRTQVTATAAQVRQQATSCVCTGCLVTCYFSEAR